MSATRGFAGIVPTESGGSGGGGGAVDSVFGRTGTVSAANGDYDSYYVSLSAAQTIVAVHTFDPAVAGAPFLLGANATGQLVTGLNADKLDGSDASAFAAASHNHAASAITSGTLALARGGVNADLSATGPGYLKQASSGASITVAYPAESEVTFTDITTGNASTSKHGYLPKLPNDATKFLDGTGAWSTLPNAGASDITFSENVGAYLDESLSADGKWTGLVIAGTAGATLAFGEVCYLAVADSRWELADSDAASTSGDVQLGICVLAAASDGSATKMLLFGTIRADAKFPTLTIGAPVHLSGTAGAVQVAAPTTTDSVTRRLGFALTADSFMFNPSPDYYTHT